MYSIITILYTNHNKILIRGIQGMTQGKNIFNS